MAKKVYTTEDMFMGINKRLEEKGLLPDSLDYGKQSWRETPIKTDEFEFKGDVVYGGSEGIYLDLHLVFDLTPDELSEYGLHDRMVHLGTYKTLVTSDDMFRKMHLLCADFLLEGNKYYREHLKDFNFSGYHLQFVSDGKIEEYASWHKTIESAERWMEKRLIKDSAESGILTDLATGKEKEMFRYDVLIKHVRTGEIMDTIICPADCIEKEAMKKLTDNESYYGWQGDWKLEKFTGNTHAMVCAFLAKEGIDLNATQTKKFVLKAINEIETKKMGDPTYSAEKWIDEIYKSDRAVDMMMLDTQFADPSIAEYPFAAPDGSDVVEKAVFVCKTNSDMQYVDGAVFERPDGKEIEISSFEKYQDLDRDFDTEKNEGLVRIEFNGVHARDGISEDSVGHTFMDKVVFKEFLIDPDAPKDYEITAKEVTLDDVEIPVKDISKDRPLESNAVVNEEEIPKEELPAYEMEAEKSFDKTR